MENDTQLPANSAATDAGTRATHPELHVVGIGASAGGLHALRTFFSCMPPDPGMAFVVVVHLSPEHDSHLVELLQPYSKMPVQQVIDTVRLARNRVYVIPPNANLNTIDTHLRLSHLEQRRIERAPIDHFLRTLANTHDGTAIAVILTGAGSDGALGIRQIKEGQGLTIAQDPVEAEYDSMPRSAIATGMVDLVLPLRQMPQAIMQFCARTPSIPIGEDAKNDATATVLEQILAEVRLQTGQDLSVYLRTAVLRRIRRRVQIRALPTLHAYLEELRRDPKEARQLCNDLLVNTTEFFREPKVFAGLAERVLPSLFDLKAGANDRVRVWSIGCSTGEEAYSLAMLMLELADERGVPRELQVFASDLSEDMLKRAREGVYPQEIAATVPPERLDRFFVREGGHYRVCREVRDLVVFAAHSLFMDPPFAHLDLIVCRNLLGDLQPVVRRGVVSLLYYALEPHGMLIVGPRDRIDDPTLFKPEPGNAQFFRRSSGPTKLLDLSAILQTLNRSVPNVEHDGAAIREGYPKDSALIHRTAIERYSLPSVLINADNQVVHYSAGSGRHLLLPGGELTHDLLKLVPGPLRSRLAIALSVVRRDGTRWSSDLFTFPGEGGDACRLVVHVDPLPAHEADGMLLVVFDEQRTLPRSAEGLPGIAPAESVARLEADLSEANERLRRLVETRHIERAESSTANQRLNEANDELWTLLDELEDAKAKLQAVNEELTTLDAENRRRLEELSQLSGDLQHLLASTGVPTLFLDRELNIVRFTPQLSELFNMRHTDVGRPFSDLTNSLDYDDFTVDSRRVLEHLVSVDREIRSSDGRWYLTRILPYRPGAHQIDGVVFTLIDITDRKNAEATLREADRRKDEFLAVLAHELRNPLAPISAGIEILKRASGNRDTVEQVAATMERQTQQLVRLVDDLLEISRISGGKLRLRKAPVQLADVMHDAVAAVRPLVQRSGHELTVKVPEESIVLNADAARVTQVLANLLNNAARYTPREGRLALIAEREDDQVLIIVRDNGIGIEQGSLDHIFEMFYQASDSRLGGNTGLGIGLTLAKSLIEMHGGTISVESEGVNRGTDVKVRLPISDAVVVPARRVSSERSLASRRVLVVDDNADAAETLSELIKTLGEHDVHTASSGDRALQIAADLRPEIILLDLMMPGMDGYEVARRIRQEPWGRETALVALTGWGQSEHRRRTKEAGFDRHLTKPADLASLQKVLGEPRATA